MKCIIGYNLEFHNCRSDESDSDLHCTRSCYDKFAFLSIDENLSPNDTPFTIHITSNIACIHREVEIDHRLLFKKDNFYEVENIIEEFPGYKFTIHNIMKTETDECCDVEYKPLLMELLKCDKYYRYKLVSNLKSKYDLDSYYKSFQNLISILTK
jgi:hypothetical protein